MGSFPLWMNTFVPFFLHELHPISLVLNSASNELIYIWYLNFKMRKLPGKQVLGILVCSVSECSPSLCRLPFLVLPFVYGSNGPPARAAQEPSPRSPRLALGSKTLLDIQEQLDIYTWAGNENNWRSIGFMTIQVAPFLIKRKNRSKQGKQTHATMQNSRSIL